MVGVIAIGPATAALRLPVADEGGRHPRDATSSAVDAFTRMKLQDLLLSVARRCRITVLLVTHDLDEALYLGGRVLIMNANPGGIRREVVVDADRPRDRRDPYLAGLKADLLTELYNANLI